MNVHHASARIVSGPSTTIALKALASVPLVGPGDDLAEIILAAIANSDERLCDGDILVVAQKIVSKAQSRCVHLRTVTPSPEAERLAREVNKDARLVELILRESTEVIRSQHDVLIVAHKLGFIMANAGIDQSNVDHGTGDHTALLLPEKPDETCAQLCDILRQRSGASVAVIINDSHGRAFRKGTVGVAIGCCGLAPLLDLRGVPDLYQRPLHSTEVGFGDEIAAAASLLMGQANEGRPIVLVRGIPNVRGKGLAADLIRPRETDLFRAKPTPTIGLLFSNRRSIRRYTEEAVSGDVIKQVLEAAATAPSAHNRQPWRFLVLKSAGRKVRLAQAMADRLREDRSRDGDPSELIEQDVTRSMARITGSPVVILICLTMEEMDHYPDPRRAAAEHQMAVQGTAMAMQNLLLAAQAAGLGAAIMCAPLFCPDTVRNTLALSATWEPQALITMGYPAGIGKPFSRRPLHEIVYLADS
jgi:coenzyme F420-0:L-glutamate ligase/coenzyme F420-1:gamma-L-glutamate ligase